MSHYIGDFLNKQTKETEQFYCLDDYFAPHVYGFRKVTCSPDKKGGNQWEYMDPHSKVYTKEEMAERYEET